MNKYIAMKNILYFDVIAKNVGADLSARPEAIPFSDGKIFGGGVETI